MCVPSWHGGAAGFISITNQHEGMYRKLAHALDVYRTSVASLLAPYPDESEASTVSSPARLHPGSQQHQDLLKGARIASQCGVPAMGAAAAPPSWACGGAQAPQLSAAQLSAWTTEAVLVGSKLRLDMEQVCMHAMHAGIHGIPFRLGTTCLQACRACAIMHWRHLPTCAAVQRRGSKFPGKAACCACCYRQAFRWPGLSARACNS